MGLYMGLFWDYGWGTMDYLGTTLGTNGTINGTGGTTIGALGTGHGMDYKWDCFGTMGGMDGLQSQPQTGIPPPKCL